MTRRPRRPSPRTPIPQPSPFAIGCYNALPYILISWAIILLTAYILTHI